VKVILRQEVKNLGQKNDLLDVDEGYALSTLLPRRLALVATPFQLKIHAERLNDRTSPSAS
jgi:large subunit ribosomal protein L9